MCSLVHLPIPKQKYWLGSDAPNPSDASDAYIGCSAWDSRYISANLEVILKLACFEKYTVSLT